MPFYEKRGMTTHGYGELAWRWLILNRKPHSRWEEPPPPRRAPRRFPYPPYPSPHSPPPALPPPTFFVFGVFRGPGGAGGVSPAPPPPARPVA